METPKSKRVMVAVDDTEVSAYAFQWALGNFISEGDYVIVLSAAPYLGIDYPNADMASGTDICLVRLVLKKEW